MQLLVKTMYGLEPLLAKELEGLGAKRIEIAKRAVSCFGNKELMYKVNLHSRLALRVLQPILSFNAQNEDQLYSKVYDLRWPMYFSPDHTFAVDSVAFSNVFRHSKYVGLKTKDAIVDRFRKETGKRPSVATYKPDVQLNVHVADKKVTVSFDSSGYSLHKRGYRDERHNAPINEVTAAGMVLMSGWTPDQPFHDPMCGSGTLPIEAAMIACNMPANWTRNDFGFMRWQNFDRELWKGIYDDATARIQKNKFPITGADKLMKNVAMSRQAAAKMGLQKQQVTFYEQDFMKEEPKEGKGVLIVNPPYGERLREEDLIGFYQEMGGVLKHSFTDWKAFVLSTNIEALKQIGLKTSSKQKLFNGGLECGFYEYDLYEGSK